MPEITEIPPNLTFVSSKNLKQCVVYDTTCKDKKPADSQILSSHMTMRGISQTRFFFFFDKLMILFDTFENPRVMTFCNGLHTRDMVLSEEL